MPLTQLTNDASLDFVAHLPLSAIVGLRMVQRAWRDFVDGNEKIIYHNAAVLHGFIGSESTSLNDAIAALDFDATDLDIRGWREFCEPYA